MKKFPWRGVLFAFASLAVPIFLIPEVTHAAWAIIGGALTGAIAVALEIQYGSLRDV